MEEKNKSGYENSASYILGQAIHLLRDEVKKNMKDYILRFKPEDRPFAKEELVAFINHELIDYIRDL